MIKPEILKQFECTGCGDCCRWGGSVLLTDPDIDALAAFTGMTPQEFIDRQTRLAPDRRRLALLDQADGSCAFLEGNDCSVYPARPEQCRTFPYKWSVPEGCPELDRLLEKQKSVE
jgi:Fe-S-cluster containining protein